MEERSSHYSQEQKERDHEIEFYHRVALVICQKTNPLYNVFLLISAAYFAYFVVME